MQAATAVGASLQSFSVDSAGELTVDVAIVGPSVYSSALVVSSGLHGIEGFFGSAVQRALLDRLKQDTFEQNIRLVLIHALNPFGFMHLRRFDQNNVDLNRNFLESAAHFAGASAGYDQLDYFLNPKSAPTKLEPYKLKALWMILRHGVPALKAAIVKGQYDYPEGIFYGGSGLSRTAEIIRANYNQWLGNVPVAAHIDLHSGLGSFAGCKLLLSEDHNATRYPWYADTFGAHNIEPISNQKGTAYEVTGSLDRWLQSYCSDRQFYFVGAEFGTYKAQRVLGAIRAENRAHHYSRPGDPIYKAAKAELLECFCPQSDVWRQKVLDSSMDIINRAAEGLKKKV